MRTKDQCTEDLILKSYDCTRLLKNRESAHPLTKTTGKEN